MIPRMVVVMFAVLLSCTATTLMPSVAHAEDQIALSRDGNHWSRSLSGPLLDPDFRWVPGDRKIEAFYVRNDGPTAARLVVEVRSADVRLLAEDAVHLSARVDDGAWAEVVNGEPSATLTKAMMRQDGVAKVQLAIEFVARAPNATQRRSLPIDFVVRLDGSDAGRGKTGDRNEEDNGASGSLPDTGAEVEAWQLWLAAMLFGAGLALVVRRRAAREDANCSEVGHA